MSAALSVLEAALLGIVQGLSEFLPISSTAHVTLVGRLLGALDDQRLHEWTAFLAVVQLGTLAAVLAYFRHDIARLGRGFLVGAAARVRGARPAQDVVPDERLAWLVVVGTLPIALAGLALRDFIEGPFTKNLWFIAGSLIFFALLLGLAEFLGRRGRTLHGLDWGGAAFVGAFQAMALMPGASRSGTTLTGGLFLGLEREAAARFSFLLAIPAIAASGILQLPLLLDAATIPWPSLLAALATSAASGYLAIDFLMKFLRSNATWVFVGYRVLLGGAILALLGFGLVEAL